VPDPRRANCQRCGKNRDRDGVHISWRGLCPACSHSKVEANVLGLMGKSGDAYTHWVRRSYMAAKRTLVASEQSEA
jgi:hypothetical protein